MPTLIGQTCEPPTCSQVPEYCICRLLIWQTVAPAGLKPPSTCCTGQRLQLGVGKPPSADAACTPAVTVSGQA